MDQLGVRLLQLLAHADRGGLAGVQNHRGDPLRHQTLQGLFRTPRTREASALVAETWGKEAIQQIAWLDVGFIMQAFASFF